MREAGERIRRMALQRPYRRGAVRASPGRSRIVRRTGDGGYLRLNEAAALVMDALDQGSPQDGAEALRRNGAPSARAERDALRATRDLIAKGVVVPAGSRRDGRAPLHFAPGPSDLPGMEPTGEAP
jgi:hypothetical protein